MCAVGVTNWVDLDGDLPLRYAFMQQDTDTYRATLLQSTITDDNHTAGSNAIEQAYGMRPLSQLSGSRSVQSWLTQGEAASDYRADVLAVVVDALGAESRLRRTLRIVPYTVPDDTRLTEATVDALNSAGDDPYKTQQMVIEIAATLDSEEADASPVVVENSTSPTNASTVVEKNKENEKKRAKAKARVVERRDSRELLLSKLSNITQTQVAMSTDKNESLAVQMADSLTHTLMVTTAKPEQLTGAATEAALRVATAVVDSASQASLGEVATSVSNLLIAAESDLRANGGTVCR